MSDLRRSQRQRKETNKKEEYEAYQEYEEQNPDYEDQEKITLPKKKRGIRGVRTRKFSYLKKTTIRVENNHLLNGGTCTYPSKSTPKRQRSRTEEEDTSFEKWSVEKVGRVISSLNPTLTHVTELFRQHEIDGRALSLLTVDVMVKRMKLTLGSALKIDQIVSNLKNAK